ncbi:hypothetical protein IC229_30140 [Spirosoma sp. BT702]|uniref:Uncharacterized protein n=1 Tax=Spirosoma profusum TaxID=2771354 RepID=A0A927AV10_9BACT|nr:hypothetical protein [Spirosoma profusum]MBD2704930.1 hypothetical protein [Spirosoma profusum]
MTRSKRSGADISYLLRIGKILMAVGEEYCRNVKVAFQAEGAGIKNVGELSRLRKLSVEKVAEYPYTIMHANNIFTLYIRYAVGRSKLSQSEKDDILKECKNDYSDHYDLQNFIKLLNIDVSESEVEDDQSRKVITKEPTVFIGYIWNVTEMYIKIISITFSFSKQPSKGTCLYKIYDHKRYVSNFKMNGTLALFYNSQEGEFRHLKNNLTAITRSTELDDVFETYFSIRANYFLDRKDKHAFRTGFLTTILGTENISTGLVILQAMESEEAVEKEVIEIFEERRKHDESEKNNKLKLFYEDTRIHPFIQHVLYNHSFNTIKETLVQTIDDLDPSQYTFEINEESNKRIAGYYEYHYLDAKHKEIVNGIMYIGPNGRSFMYTHKQVFYFGLFQIIQDDTASLRFDFKENKRFHRLSIIISLYDRLNTPYLYGVYSAIEHGHDLPVHGRIRFTKIQCNSFLEAQSTYPPSVSIFNLRELSQRDSDNEENLKSDLWEFIRGKLPTRDAFGESLYFYEDVLSQQKLDLIDGKLIFK